MQAPRRMSLSDGGASVCSVLLLCCDPQACDRHESQRQAETRLGKTPPFPLDEHFIHFSKGQMSVTNSEVS